MIRAISPRRIDHQPRGESLDRLSIGLSLDDAFRGAGFDPRRDVESLPHLDARFPRAIEQDRIHPRARQADRPRMPIRDPFHRHLQSSPVRRIERHPANRLCPGREQSLRDPQPLKDRHALGRDELPAQLMARKPALLQQQDPIALPRQQR